MLVDIANYLINLAGQLWYPGLFVACFFENLFPPIPSELIMPFGGILAAQGKMTLWGAILATSLWSTIGSIPYYFLGLYLHKDRVLRWTDRIGKYFFLSRQDMEEVYQTFDKYGYTIVFWCRFVPVGRWFISLPAGSVGMPFWKFFLYSYAGTLIWSILLVMIGYMYGQNKEIIHNFVSQYEKIALGIVICVFFFIVTRFLYYKWRRNR